MFPRYRPEVYPVLAFVGPPAPFPVTAHNAKLHRYIQWSDQYNIKAEELIMENFYDLRPFIAIHLRNGVDFVSNPCQAFVVSNTFFRFLFGSCFTYLSF